MKTFLFKGLILFLIFCTEMPVAFGQITVASIPWSKYDTRPLDGVVAQQTYQLYQNGLKYTMNDWYNKVKKFDRQSGMYLDFGGRTEHYIRPIAHNAFALALALRLNIYDPKVIGVPTEKAHQVGAQLIRSLAYRHKANYGEKDGWGNLWQSAAWAYQACLAAWIVWDELSEADQLLVYQMAVYESDRFLEYQVPYYKDLTAHAQ